LEGLDARRFDKRVRRPGMFSEIAGLSRLVRIRRFSQGGRGYGRCSWAAAPFITSGRDKYRSYQDKVWREIDAPTAAAVAWQVILRGVMRLPRTTP
jgi:hypothetical protein